MAVAVLETQTLGLRHLVKAAGVRGHRVILLTCDRSLYRHVLGPLGDALDVVDVDTNDVERVVEVLRGYPGVAGLVRMTDNWSLSALAIAQELGLPHQNAEAIKLLRDKGRLRKHLYVNGFTRAPSFVFDPHDAYEELVIALPFPGVVKDVIGNSSENVWLVRRPEDLPGVLAEARSVELRGGMLTAEPYFIGPLYSAETVSWGGETRVIGVTSRALSPEPHFREEIASFPVRFPEQRHAELERWIAAILSSVGYTEGVTHTEFIVTTSGCEIVEINARMGGALIGENISVALGVNMHSAFIDLALGRRPLLMDQQIEMLQGSTQIALYAPAAGIFDRIDGAEALSDHPGSPKLYPYRSPGEIIASTTDQRGVVAFVLATGTTAELSMHNAMAAATKLTVRMR